LLGDIVTGIQLVKKSVDFIKENINTCRDISEIAGSIDDLLDGKQQLDKKRSKKDGMSLADQFGVKTVANEVIDAKLAAEELYNVSVLVDQRFGHGTWASIIAERKKRIDEAKKAEKERIKVRKQQQEELLEILSFLFLGVVGIIALFGIVYIFINI
jgi:hypothetical protein